MVIPQIVFWIGRDHLKNSSKKIQEEVEFLSISRNARNNFFFNKHNYSVLKLLTGLVNAAFIAW